MNTKHASRRATFVIATGVLLAGLGAVPASARPDPGPSMSPHTGGTSFCSLQRVGQQFVACDNLTGNGVPAPGWVQER